jgi:hypothetical protein
MAKFRLIVVNLAELTNFKTKKAAALGYGF